MAHISIFNIASPTPLSTFKIRAVVPEFATDGASVSVTSSSLSNLLARCGSDLKRIQLGFHVTSGIMQGSILHSWRNLYPKLSTINPKQYGTPKKTLSKPCTLDNYPSRQRQIPTSHFASWAWWDLSLWHPLCICMCKYVCEDLYMGVCGIVYLEVQGILNCFHTRSRCSPTINVSFPK